MEVFTFVFLTMVRHYKEIVVEIKRRKPLIIKARVLKSAEVRIKHMKGTLYDSRKRRGRDYRIRWT